MIKDDNFISSETVKNWISNSHLSAIEMARIGHQNWMRKRLQHHLDSLGAGPADFVDDEKDGSK